MGVFAMPSLGADMEAGTLVEWLVKPGDHVTRGDIVAVVETQKGAIEIEIFEEGEVTELLAELGQKLPVGAPLARIGGEAGAPAPSPPEAAPPPAPEAAPPPAPEAAPKAAPEPARTPEPPPAPPPAPAEAPKAAPAATGLRASPAARALAADRGVDLARLTGTGPDGAVVLADVEAAGAAPTAAPAPAPAKPPASGLEAMREAIAAAMARAKREIPHYYLAHTVDLQAAADWVAAENAAREPKDRLLIGALILKAAAKAAAVSKGINGHYAEAGFRPSEAVHAGMAVALRGGGLVAPAIRDTDTLTLDALMEKMRDVVARARAGRLRSSEMSEGTITISALGERGVDAMTGVIYPPQVALVAVGTPRREPRVTEEGIVPRLVVTVTLAADHRVSDGRIGARYLAELAAILQKPEEL